jgi:nucleoside-diphosphate-sugar epimerase
VCVPGSGDQLSVVAHAEDVAAMMAAAVGCDAAAGQAFNAVTNKVRRRGDGVECMGCMVPGPGLGIQVLEIWV